MKLFKILLASVVFMSGIAQAGTLRNSFVSSNNIVFSLYGVREVTFNAGSVAVVFASGDNSSSYLQDSSGSVATSIKNSAMFNQQFVRVGTSQRYINVDSVKYAYCTDSGTLLGWSNAGSETIADGCQFHNSMKNAAN